MPHSRTDPPTQDGILIEGQENPQNIIDGDFGHCHGFNRIWPEDVRGPYLTTENTQPTEKMTLKPGAKNPPDAFLPGGRT
jgi:hypothetical protein